MSESNWSDLKTRILSALVLAVLCITLLCLGGFFSAFLIVVLCAAFTCESSLMIEPV